MTTETERSLDQGGTGPDKRCDTCERVGRNIPVRIAIGLEHSGVKSCPSHLTKNYPSLPKGFVYTLRTLEAGYLYVYGDYWSHDHHSQGLGPQVRAYRVSTNGYLTTIPLDTIVEHEDVEKTHINCFEQQGKDDAKSEKEYVIREALCLDVYGGMNEFGIIFSRHQITRNTIKELEENISDFLMVSVPEIRHEKRLKFDDFYLIQEFGDIDFSENHAWIKDKDISNNTIIKNKDSIIEAFELVFPKHEYVGFPIVVVDDPVGILKDIGQITRFLKEKYNKNNEKDLFMDAKLSELQFGVQNTCTAGAYLEIEDYTRRGILSNYKKGLRPDEMMYGLQGNKFKINSDYYSKSELKKNIE